MRRIECIDLVKKYGRKLVVDKASLYVHQGEVVGLLGPNGAGKTTIFKMILGAVVPSYGKILLDDMDITHLPIYERAKLGITYLQQDTSVFNGLKVSENVELILRFQKKDHKEISKTVEMLLDEFGILELKDQYAMDLSGGEKRKLELARMMALNPVFLLLDEPFVGIDPKTVKDIQKVILSLREKGIGVIVTDHTVDALAQIVDRLYVIHKGKIVAEGDPENTLKSEIVREVYLGT